MSTPPEKRSWWPTIQTGLLLLACVFTGLGLVQSGSAASDATKAAHQAAGAARAAASATNAQRAANETNAARDAARTYQRCEQTAGLFRAVNRLIVRGNDALGPLPLVDEPNCRRTYPLGFRESARYPDVAPTKPARRPPTTSDSDSG